MDLAVHGGDDERLVDVRPHPSSGDRRFGHQIEPGPDRVAVHGELGHRRGLDDSILRPAIQAAAQVITRESGLQPNLYAGATGRDGTLSAS